MACKKEIKLSDIAKNLNSELIGEDCFITSVVSIENDVEDSITLVGKKKLLDIFLNGKFKAALIHSSLKGKQISKPHIFVDDIKFGLKVLLDIFYPDEKIENYISKKASIGKDVKLEQPVYIDDFVKIGDESSIGEGTVIGANVVIGNNVKIGKNCKIYPNVSIYDEVQIGDGVIIHSGAVIGSDGFGYVNTREGHFKIKQVGSVIVEDNVEIGANTCIDRGTLENTVIGRGTKIDNLVQIAHNVKIGAHSIIVSQTGIAGSTSIGNFVILGGQVGVVDHINIGDGVIVASKAGVMSDIKKPGVYTGAPAIEHKKWLKQQVYLRNLEKYIKK